MKFSYIPPLAMPELPGVILRLREIEPYLLPRCDAADLYFMCLRGEATLWGAFDDQVSADCVNECMRGLVVTRPTVYPKGTWLTIMGLSGENFDDWAQLAFDTLNDFRKKNGWRGLEEWGRDGWLKKLQKFGFRKVCVLMETEDDGQEQLSTISYDEHSNSDITA